MDYALELSKALNMLQYHQINYTHYMRSLPVDLSVVSSSLWRGSCCCCGLLTVARVISHPGTTHHIQRVIGSKLSQVHLAVKERHHMTRKISEMYCILYLHV